MRAREGSAVADLRRGFDAWLEAPRERDPKHFKKMRRLARQGEKDFGLETVTFGPAASQELAKLIGWKREQFARTRRHDVLSAGWTLWHLEECASHSDRGFGGVMAILRYRGRIAAAEFGLRSGTTLHGSIAGYDPAYASCSPGLVLHVLEQGRFGAASRLAGRTRRRLDVILAVETSVGGQLRGVQRALGEDPSIGQTRTALKAALRVAPF